MAFVLSDYERRTLAVKARQEAAEQEDPRYWDPDPDEREWLRARWRAIADHFHPDPYAEPPKEDL